MGKSKRQTGRERRQQAAQPYSIKQTQAQAKIQTFIDDLASMAPSKRAAACVALCNVFDTNSENKDMLLSLCSVSLLRALNVRLMDPNQTVRLHAAGAIRNLAASKVEQVCERVMQAGLLDSIFGILQQRCTAEVAPEFVQYMEQLLGAVASFCESHEAAVEAFANSHLVPQIARLAATSSASAGVCRRAAELVHVCSDNSPAICEQLCQDQGLIDLVVSVCSGSAASAAAADAPCRVHLCGALVHVAMYTPSIPAPTAIALVQQLLEVLTTFIIPQLETWQDASQEMQRLLQQRNEQSAAAAAVSADASEKEEEAEITMEGQSVEIHNVTAEISELEDGPWISIVQSHITACEVLANVVCGLRDGKEVNQYDTVDWASDDEDAMEKVAHTMGVENAAAGPQAVSSEWDAVVAQLVQMSALQNFMQLLQTHIQALPSQEIANFPPSHALDFVTAIDRETTLISNLLSLLPAEAIQPLVGDIFGLADGLSDAVARVGVISDAVTKALGTLMRDCGLCLTCLLRRPDVEIDPSLMLQLSSRGTVLRLATFPAHQAQLAGIELITAWASLQAQLPVEHLCVITDCLLSIVENPSPMATRRFQQCVELTDAALGALMDLHSGDSEEGLYAYQKCDAQTKLRGAVNAFGSMIKADGVEREDKIRYKETQLNLKRFVQYKSRFLS